MPAMIITYHGGEFFKVQFGETALAFNPISKNSKLKAARFGADLALVTVNHPDMNGLENLEFGDRKPFAIYGAGEYEVKEIFVTGFNCRSGYAGQSRINTVYAVRIEGMTLCFLGALGSEKDAPRELKELPDSIDVLFVPIGGDGVLRPAEAYKLAVQLEPKIIIPMHYGQIGDKTALKVFLKEGGEEDLKPVDKLTLKKKDLEGKTGEIIVLAES
jgi:L-ascorbate metabolism protein UlaG (beta-lactamase superfamily)